MPPRLFLVAPDLPAAHLIACLKAAVESGDVASVLVPLSVAKLVAPDAQALGLAVMTTGEPRDALRAGCDGLHAASTEDGLGDLRASLGKSHVLGVHCGASRHFAMEAAERGADYLALDQNGPALGGEPIVKWCAEFLEVPTVAFEPATPQDLDTLLPQKPDFIRPSNAMWEGAEASRRIIVELMQRLKS